MSIPYVTDGETDLDSALFNPIIDALNDATDTIADTVGAIANAGAGTFNVLDAAYGAVGDGVTDDTPAVQRAVDAAIAALDAGDISAAFIDFVGGRFLLDPVSGFGPSSMKWCVYVDHNDITLRGQGATIVLGTGHVNGTGIFSFAGGNVPDGTSGWLSHWLGNPNNVTTYPIYAIDPADKGDGSITLSTAADAADFVVGEAIWIRTGETITVQGAASEPDAEMNIVTGTDAGTGVVTLKWPLSKAYVQEYFDTDPPVNPSTTASSSYPALFGVQRGDAAILRNCYMQGLNFEFNQAAGHAYAGWFFQVIGCGVTDCTAVGANGALQNGGSVRDLAFKRNTVRISQTIAADLWCGTNTGTNDASFEDNDLSCDTTLVSLFHIHEGSANVRIARNRIRNVPNASNNHAIQIFGRGYDIAIQDNHIEHDSSSSGVPLYVTDGAQNVAITGNTLIGNDSVIYSPSALVFNNSGRISIQDGRSRTGTFTISKWVYYNSAATINLGDIPAAAFVTDIQVQVFTAFNGTTPTLKIGAHGIYAGWFMEAADLSSTGMPSFTRNATSYVQESIAAGYRTAEINYSAGGSSAGKALVVLTWTMAERGSGV